MRDLAEFVELPLRGRRLIRPANKRRALFMLLLFLSLPCNHLNAATVLLHGIQDENLHRAS